MQGLNKTTMFNPLLQSKNTNENFILTIFDKDKRPQTINLKSWRQSVITFGRGMDCDIVLESRLVSLEHGRLYRRNGQWRIEDKGAYQETGSTNGLIYNNAAILSRNLCDGDFIRIDDGIETVSEGVLFVFSNEDSNNEWKSIEIEGKDSITMGRDSTCDIVLPHVSISKRHAKIVCQSDGYYLIDENSTNGIVINNRHISGKQKLHEKDVIAITTSKLIFTSKTIYYCCYKSGISVDVNHVSIVRGSGRKKKTTVDNVSLNIKPGELVAIVGGSGAGKSTILNCMCGYLEPEKGDVYINGISLYENFNSLKNLIGYVPQSDIVYDNLTLKDMLSYTAKLRLPKDTTREERKEAIEQAIELVELKDKSNSLIKSLSGGQKKRASIAVELLSDPNLLFLDEPASGLDPGTEKHLMGSLRQMANNGKTIILVTHSTLQLELCDKIIFMGNGGKLCYFGSLKEALGFFNVSDSVDIYDMLSTQASEWRKEYDVLRKVLSSKEAMKSKVIKQKIKKRFQLPVLSFRYLKLVINDRQRLLLLLIQAPLLALLISLVADGQEFKQYEMTKSLLFALSCSAFWVGMLNAIQEICKERSILKREYMAGLSLTSYILSKILVLGILCVIQSICIVAVFSVTVGLPDKGLMISPFAELLITTILTAIASTAMGLFVSSLFKNADRAMTVAPILLMPQILFSGLIFELDGITKNISWFALCRWSMEGYGTTANLNKLPLKMQQQGIKIPHEAEDFFEFTKSHMGISWGILIGFTIIFLVLARFVLRGIGKEKN